MWFNGVYQTYDIINTSRNFIAATLFNTGCAI